MVSSVYANDHEIQFIEKRCAFISMGSKMLYNMLSLSFSQNQLKTTVANKQVSGQTYNT